MNNQFSSRKIAYIVSLFPKLSETFILNEILELKKKGMQIEIFSLSDFTLSKNKEETIHKDALPLIPYVYYSHNTISGLIKRAAVIAYNPFCALWIVIQVLFYNILYKGRPVKALQTIFNAFEFAFYIKNQNIQHIHAHFLTSPTLAAWVIYRMTGISFSATSHAHDIFCPMPMVTKIFNDIKFLVTISEYNRKFLLSHYGPDLDTKISVIHCGIRLDMFSPVVKKKDSKKDIWQLLSIGRLVDYKGFPVLLKACRIIKDHAIKFKCIIVGTGPDFASIKNLITMLHIQESVFLIGNQEQNKIKELLLNTDIFILASQRGARGLQDGIPVALMESLALGIPSISTRISGIPELIRDGENGLLVSPQSPEMLANAIERIIKDSTLRDEFICMGPLTIEANFNSNHNAAKLMRLFGS